METALPFTTEQLIKIARDTQTQLDNEKKLKLLNMTKTGMEPGALMLCAQMAKENGNLIGSRWDFFVGLVRNQYRASRMTEQQVREAFADSMKELERKREKERQEKMLAASPKVETEVGEPGEKPLIAEEIRKLRNRAIETHGNTCVSDIRKN